MQAKFAIERAADQCELPWFVTVQFDRDEPEIISEHATKSAALAAMSKAREEHDTIEMAERHYQAQIAYVCGERD